MITRSDLNILEQKILSGNATAEDYEKLNEYVSSIGVNDFLLSKLREFNVSSFDEYVARVNGTEKGSSLESKFRGAVLGVISVLRTIIK